ncbi:putative transporter [Psychromonas marina]|uniref:Transporter n=1 Tax=Psychromonas marina TaxID=88364 RepID=A0ABQ6E026_9GAMM|nr:aspartate-alanine antiporter [Psychromonas marina]GLS90787.1 putative transporter [Psychromonas marina]
MNIIHQLFEISPFIALFMTLSLGYIIGKITIGRFTLGSVAGTLLMGVIIGQFGVSTDPEVKSIFFALFIYAVGYQGGALFFKELNFKSLKFVLSAIVMTTSSLLCVLAAAWIFDLDQGTAAGLAAGGLTQSTIIGSAGDAINNLGGLTDSAKQLLQNNLAVGYAVTYIFGLLGPIIMITWIIPAFMKWDIRKEAILHFEKKSDNTSALTSGEFNSVTALVTRAFKVDTNSTLNGMILSEVNITFIDACIELVERDGHPFMSDQSTMIQEHDVVIITGRSDVIYQLQDNVIGLEVAIPEGLNVIEESRQLLVNNKKLIGKTLQELTELANKMTDRGIYVTHYMREGCAIEITPELNVEKNDIIEITGSTHDISQVENNIGKPIGYSYAVDFAIFGLGIVLGLFIGLIGFKVAGVPVHIGSGAGCLTSGLIIGWLRHRKPSIATLPIAASSFIRDLGLAVFIAIIGLEAGPHAVHAIKEHGTSLLFLGAAVTLIPQVIAFLFSYYVLKIKNPIEALGSLAGGRNAKPAFAALIEKSGNAAPVFSFTVTYAVSSILLTLCGPIIVVIMTLHGGM